MLEEKSPNVFQDIDGSLKLGYKGFIHPMRDEDVIPTIQKMICSALENIDAHPETIDRDNVVGLLEMLLECTVPEKGYVYSPYVPVTLKGKEITT